MGKINYFDGNFINFFHKTGGCIEINNVYAIYFSQIQLSDNISTKRAVGISIIDTFSPFFIVQPTVYPEVDV